MASAAKLARGTQIKVETSPGSGTYVSIPEAKVINAPNIQAAEVDVTNHDSAARTNEYLPGTIDPGEVTFEFNYLSANTYHVQAISDQPAGTIRNYSIEEPSPSTHKIRFAAYVKGVQRVYDFSREMTLSLTLRVTGAVTEVA